MPQADSFQMRAQTPGVLVSDFSYTTPAGGIAPVLLKTGDVIDLERVQVDAYMRSANMGVLASMEEGGSLVRVAVEVSEKTFDALREANLRFPRPRPVSRYPHATEVVTIEPGMQVAVGGAPAPKSALPVVPAVVEPPKSETYRAEAAVIEPGLQVGSTATPEAPVEEAAAEEATPSWKDGKTLAEQERFIQESEDREFLAQVAGDPEESKKLKRLAANRLKSL